MQVKDNLRYNAAHGRVDYPPLNGECEDRQGKVWRAFEKDMRDDAAVAAFLFYEMM